MAVATTVASRAAMKRLKASARVVRGRCVVLMDLQGQRLDELLSTAHPRADTRH
jgi:hypothetical protein